MICSLGGGGVQEGGAKWRRAPSAALLSVVCDGERETGWGSTPACMLRVDRGLCCAGERNEMSVPQRSDRGREEDGRKKGGRMLQPHYIQRTSVLAASSRGDSSAQGEPDRNNTINQRRLSLKRPGRQCDVTDKRGRVAPARDSDDRVTPVSCRGKRR